MDVNRGVWMGRILAFVAVTGVAAVGAMVDPMSMGRTDMRPPVSFHAPDHPQLPAFRGERGDPIADSLRMSGQDVQLRHFQTDDPPEEVADYYQQSFEDLGREVVRYTIGGVTHVSAIADDGAILTVNVFHQEGATFVVPGVSRGGMLPGAEAKEMPLPIPPDATAVLTGSSVDAGRKSATAQFIMPRGMEAVAAWYQEQLGAAGYHELPRGQAPGQVHNYVLRFQRGDAHANVGLQGLDEEAGTMVFLLHEAPLAQSAGGMGR
jgi:hypothetical protein